jgi:hypothetical protein
VTIEALGTLRVIGIAPADAMREVTLVLVETDGDQRIRRLETRAVALDFATNALPATRSRALVGSVMQFIGNLVLQPFAVDAIGISNDCAQLCDANVLAAGTHVAVATPCDVHDPSRPEAAAAIAAYLAARNIRLRWRAA